MRVTIGLIMIIFCLTGCSEMRVIGDAAMREMRADAISTNWSKTDSNIRVNTEKPKEQKQYVASREKTFSTFSKGQTDRRIPAKGLWERHGS